LISSAYLLEYDWTFFGIYKCFVGECDIIYLIEELDNWTLSLILLTKPDKDVKKQSRMDGILFGVWIFSKRSKKFLTISKTSLLLSWTYLVYDISTKDGNYNEIDSLKISGEELLFDFSVCNFCCNDFYFFVYLWSGVVNYLFFSWLVVTGKLFFLFRI
jgi:hypothetical protein